MRISTCGMRCVLGALVVFLLCALMQAEPVLAKAVSHRDRHSNDGVLSASFISTQRNVQRRHLPYANGSGSGAHWNTRSTAYTSSVNVCYVQGKAHRFGTTWQMKVRPHSVFCVCAVPSFCVLCVRLQAALSGCVLVIVLY